MCAAPPGESVSVAVQREMCVDIAVRENLIPAWPVVRPTPVATSPTAVRCVTMLPHRKATSAYTCSRTNTLTMFKMGDTRMVTYKLLTLPTTAAPLTATPRTSPRTSSRSLSSRPPTSPPSSHHLHTLTLTVSGGDATCAIMRPALHATFAYTPPARNTHITCYGSRGVTICRTAGAWPRSLTTYKTQVSDASHRQLNSDINIRKSSYPDSLSVLGAELSLNMRLTSQQVTEPPVTLGSTLTPSPSPSPSPSPPPATCLSPTLPLSQGVFQCLVCSCFTSDSLESVEQHLNAPRSLPQSEWCSLVTGGCHCKLCGYTTPLRANFSLHCQTDRHRTRYQLAAHLQEGSDRGQEGAALIIKGNPIQLRCNLCDYVTSSLEKLRGHSLSSNHEASVRVYRVSTHSSVIQFKFYNNPYVLGTVSNFGGKHVQLFEFSCVL